MQISLQLVKQLKAYETLVNTIENEVEKKEGKEPLSYESIIQKINEVIMGDENNILLYKILNNLIFIFIKVRLVSFKSVYKYFNISWVIFFS